MKFRIFIILGSLLLMIALSGCKALLEKLAPYRTKIQGKADVVTNEAAKRVDELKKQFEETKTSVTQKVSDIKNAAKEVKEATKEVDEAVEAVKKVTE